MEKINNNHVVIVIIICLTIIQICAFIFLKDDVLIIITLNLLSLISGFKIGTKLLNNPK